MKQADTLLLVTTSYPRWANGREAAGAFVADLAEELSTRVHVRVVAPGDRQDVETVSETLSVYRYAAPQRRLVNLRMWNPLEAWKIFRTLLAGAKAVDAATRDGRVFHILALWALPPGQWALQASRRRRIPYSVWMLGSDVWALSRIPVVKHILRRVMRLASTRFADGFELAEDSQRLCQRDVQFLPSTRKLSITSPSPPSDTPPYRLVFIGRWHRNKGIDLFLDALETLGHDDWSLIEEVRIYGGGPLAKEVEQKVESLVGQGRPVELGGFIPKPQAEQAILRADYLVIPSRIESIPVVFSDALKLGRPVISTPVGDLPLLFEEAACGVMADDISAAGIGRAVQKALRSQPSMFATAVEAQAKRFDLTEIALKILENAAAPGAENRPAPDADATDPHGK